MLVVAFDNIFGNDHPIRIEDKDGAEEEDEEGGRSVHKSHRCSSLKSYFWKTPSLSHRLGWFGVVL